MLLGVSADEFVPERWLGHMEPPIAAVSPCLVQSRSVVCSVSQDNEPRADLLINMVQLGQEIGDEDTRRGLVAKIIVQIVQLFDITLSNPTPSPASSAALAATRFSIHSSIEGQLAAAGIHPKSAMAGHASQIRGHLGDQCLRTLLEARASDDFTANQKYSTLHGLKTDPISDNDERKPLHQAIEAISKGALETKTDPDDKCITLGGIGFGTYLGYRRNASERGNDRGRGRGRRRRRGRGREHGRERLDDRSDTSRRSNTPSITATNPRISGWNNFHSNVKDEDRAANVAANARVDAMARKQEADDTKFVETYKKTTIVNGVRTTVEVLKNGQSEGGGVALPQQEPEKNSNSPLKLPSTYVPPHKRVNPISPEKAAVSGSVGTKDGNGSTGIGDTGVLDQSSTPQNKVSQFQAESGRAGESSTPQHKLENDG